MIIVFLDINYKKVDDDENNCIYVMINDQMNP